MHFTYTECTVHVPVHSPRAWRGPRPGERHCKSDPQTLIQDAHSAASIMWAPLYISHWKSTLHAASAVHRVPKEGGSAAWPAAEGKPNALILPWMLLSVSKFHRMKQIWLSISLVLLTKLKGNLLWVWAQHETENSPKPPVLQCCWKGAHSCFNPQFKCCLDQIWLWTWLLNIS